MNADETESAALRAPRCAASDQRALMDRDCEQAIALAGHDLEPLRKKRLFMTGGTGFFGTWLLEALMWANRHAELDCEVCVLSRDPEKVRSRLPHLFCDSRLSLLRGDVRTFAFPDQTFDSVIHAAAEASARLNEEDPLLMVDTIVQGTRRALDFALKARVDRFLFVSSGAVYGRQPGSVSHVDEDFSGGPDILSPTNAYHEAKRLAELVAAIYAKKHGMAVSMARCFAFVGPHLPLDTHFAIGNFIRDGLLGKEIVVRGDGTPLRSYQYASDLIGWLLAILHRGRTGRAYNVGSDAAVSVAELARLIAAQFAMPPSVNVMRLPVPGATAERYVPSTSRAQSELGVANSIELVAAIRKTIAWHVAGDGSLPGRLAEREVRMPNART